MRMKNKSRILTMLAAGVALASCSTYNQVLKSNDHERMYRAAIEYYQAKKSDKALALFDAIEHYYTGTAREDTIAFYTAVSNFRAGDFVTSAEQLNDFRRKFSRSPFLEESEYLIALGYYYSSPVAERDQTPSQMAIMAFNEYLGRYPNSIKKEQCREYIAELTQKIYDKALLNAKVYYNIGYYKSAIHALKVSLSEYPETTHREETLYLITRASYLLAKNSIESLQHGRYLDMMDAYYNLISEFPETKYRKEATRMYEDVRRELGQTGEGAEGEDLSAESEEGVENGGATPAAAPGTTEGTEAAAPEEEQAEAPAGKKAARKEKREARKADKYPDEDAPDIRERKARK